MAYLNSSSNLFLGLQEIRSWADFLDEAGFRKYIRDNTASFGLVKNPTFDFPFVNGKVEAGTNSGTIKIGPIEAIDSDGLFIQGRAIDNVAILSSSTQFFWIKIRHKYSSIEEGTVSVDASGNLTGTGTQFLSKLRGQPEFPSKIRFVNSNNNPQEYTVLQVLDNNNAVLQGFFNGESNLQYEVVGTFTPSVVVPSGEKFPFKYDSFELQIVAGGVNPPAKVSGKEFYLARVRNNGGVMIIEDKRTELWESISSFELKTVPSVPNKFIGVEAVKFSDQFSTKDRNIVEIAWGLRSSNWTASNSLRQITISNGVGGVFKTDEIIDPFLNGDFNGWRLYFENGQYAIITESAIDAGAIKVTLDRLIPNNYSAQEQIFICPNVEGIILQFEAQSNRLVREEQYFPINTPLAKVSLIVSSEDTFGYEIKYRYKGNNFYTRREIFPNSVYFSENSFDELGNFKANPEDWETKPLIDSFVVLVAQDDSFSKTVERVDKGDKFGVRFRPFSNINPLINLTAGIDEFYQKIQYDGVFNMTVNQIINMSSIARDGNEFFIFIKGPINDPSGTWVVEVRQDYVNAGDTGVLLTTVQPWDLKCGNIILFCVFDAKTGNWSAERLDERVSPEDIGEIKIYSGNTVGKFDSTGLGISPRWQGWAVCNGQNGTPDLRKRFLMGYDPVSTSHQMNSVGGSETSTIEITNLPSHDHKIFGIADAVSGQTFNIDDSMANRRNIGNNRDYDLSPTPTNTDPTHGRTSRVGNGTPLNIVPRYFALAFVMKIQ